MNIIPFCLGAIIGYIGFKIFRLISRKSHKNSPQVNAPPAHRSPVPMNSKYRDIEVDELGNPQKQLGIVYVIRKDLKMKNGKISAQVGHASLGIFQKIQKHYPNLTNYKFDKELFYCPDDQVQLSKEKMARQNGVCSTLIHDAGRTQIAAGSATVLAFGPVDVDDVKTYTDDLTLIPKN